jgi:hypothetical protein
MQPHQLNSSKRSFAFKPKVGAPTARQQKRNEFMRATVYSKMPKRAKGQGKKSSGSSAGIQGGFTTGRSKLAGQEDVEFTTMRYETTSAFTATGGAASFLLHKGNSVYRPYSGNTDSVGGYSRMYTQYRRSLVIASRIEVRLWCATSGVQEPFRIAVFPCTVNQSTVYTAFSNIAQLRDVPHSQERLFSPGDLMPRIYAKGDSASVVNGHSRMTRDDLITEATISSGWTGTTGADPGTLWYWGVGYQNMAGTTTNNLQAQVMIEFDVMWFEPVPTAVQVAVVNKWGNEEAPESKAEAKSVFQFGAGFSQSSISIKNATVEDKGEGSLPLKKAHESVALDDDDEDEADFMEYFRQKFKARSAVRQALAFENADFSGTRPMLTGLQ